MCKSRKAFSMITAVFIIVIMSSVAAFVYALSGKMVKTTTAQYQREQAMLLAKSYTELAVMAVSANDRQNNSCLTTIVGQVGNNPNNGNGYRVRVDIHYIASSLVVGNCGTLTLQWGNSTSTNSPLNIVVDTYVFYKDLDDINGYWRRYHRRTLQKI